MGKRCFQQKGTPFFCSALLAAFFVEVKKEQYFIKARPKDMGSKVTHRKFEYFNYCGKSSAVWKQYI